VSERFHLRGRGGVDVDAHYAFDRSRRRVVNHADVSLSPPSSEEETSRVSFSNRSSASGRMLDHWRRHPRKRTAAPPSFYSKYFDFESKEGADDDLRVNQKEEEEEDHQWQSTFRYRATAGASSSSSTRGYRRRDREAPTPVSFASDDADDFYYTKEARYQPSESFQPPP
ncbi:unnamed protein product, partial [Dibothriocephalus latus]